ncbi:D-amino-acid transaminase [Defluviicoccus vanus]|uniref:Probable branched-chain-amino-acid aminotransferase n=1 Tax=Defluviicoccus vanus TaxID=111831 RepID=A0A7H1MXB6_9PROT|nr:D-amino-acid transaminase [Defluviicoccus vanus]QNT68102.1 D-amino-acid transaminase [Defluviicoccus vanus]
MGHISYVNGHYVRHARARVHIEDRGFQFADGVYEVFAIRRGRVLDAERHFERLTRSLAALRIPAPMSRAALQMVFAELIRRNNSPANGVLYLQITRGVAPRTHAFPPRAVPTLVATVNSLRPVDPEVLRAGVSVISLPDIRWRRPDIKSVSLLPNVLAKQQALEAGAYEAWLLDDSGMVTEGTASNAWIVTADGDLVTRPADMSILNGITRLVVLELAHRSNIRTVERPFSLAEAKAAKEAFLTGTTSLVKPVIRIDGATIGDGRMGTITAALQAAYLERLEDEE